MDRLPGKTLGTVDFLAPEQARSCAADVFAADWRGTGRLDLLVGTMRGDLYLLPNDGTNAKAAYGAPRKLEADGRLIPAPHHGDAQPVAADWDDDGLLDLLVGWGDGSRFGASGSARRRRY